MRRAFSIVLLVVVAACGDAKNGTAPADVVFESGAVYTMNPAQEWAQAVAVKDRRIVYVGDDAGVARHKGSDTRVVDLAGRMLMPGFIEGHTHPLFGAALTRGVDLQYNTREEIVDALQKYAATAPDRGLIHGLVRGFGWRYSAYPASGPTKADLDAIWPDVPALMIAVDGHSGWINSKALEMVGVTKDTPDVVPGFSYFYKDPQTGEPTGYVVEGPALMKVSSTVGPYTHDFIVESLEQWLPKAAEVGITGVFDAGMVLVPSDEGFAIYADLEQRGMLPFRIVGSLYFNKPGTDPLPELEELRAKYHTELLRASVLKIAMDGVDANGSAAMLEPYVDDPKSYGATLFSAEQANDLVREADARGIDVHVHAIGDRAARQSLDAIEAAIAVNPRRDRRHTIAHNQLTDPADLARFAGLGVIAEFSGQWHCKDGKYWSDVTVPRWGVERANREYRIGDILRFGGVVSLGTDWPAGGNSSVYAPLRAIQIAVTRQEVGKPDEPPMPIDTDRITLAEALHANTMGTAYQIRMEDQIGSIEVGKLADMIVLERNLFAIEVQDVADTGVVMTMMNGSFTYGG